MIVEFFSFLSENFYSRVTQLLAGENYMGWRHQHASCARIN